MTCVGCQTGKVSSQPSWERVDFAPIGFLSYPCGKDATDHERPERLFGHQSDGRCQDHCNHAKQLERKIRRAPSGGFSLCRKHQTGELVWFTWLDNDTIVANGAGNLRVVNLLKHETHRGECKERIFVRPAVSLWAGHDGSSRRRSRGGYSSRLYTASRWQRTDTGDEGTDGFISGVHGGRRMGLLCR